MIEGLSVQESITSSVKSPRPHQLLVLKDLYNASYAMNRYTCVMACGTGKTLTAMWHAEQINAKNILVLLPSLGLLNQTLKEWLKNTTIKNFRYLCVCSDQTVDKEEDFLRFMSDDLDFTVTTQSKQVSQFIKDMRPEEIKIIFSTYHSVEMIGLGVPVDFQFDLIIYDEAHKTVGEAGKAFSYSLVNNQINACKRLFLTATPRIVNKNQIQRQSEKVFLSMDNEEIYGKCAHTLNFKKAVSLDIIVDYKVIISVVTSKMVKDVLYNSSLKFGGKKIDAVSIAHLLAIQHAVHEHNIKKLITFHSKIKTAEFFNDLISEHCFDILEDFNSFHVSGEMAANVRSRNINNFRNSNKGVLTNARCLTEGVDVPVVDMVAFLCNKKSRVDIIQALGRVMRKSPGKQQGYVLIPFYIDSETDENLLEKNVSNSDYSEILHVLRVLADYDDNLNHIINASYEEAGEYGNLRNDLFKSKLSILAPNNLDINLLKKSITTITVNNIGNKWNYYYGLLRQFKKQHGHCHVPVSDTFGYWCSKQREAYRKNDLIKERIDKLNALGFVWDSSEASWEENFNQLNNFKKQYDHFNLPSKDSKYHPLNKWMIHQRYLYSKCYLHGDRVKRLEEIGFIWGVRETIWQEQYLNLQEFKNKNGHCIVTGANPLANWVAVQRNRYKKNKLDQNRVRKLNDLGFVWEVNDTFWNNRYEELQVFKKTYGHCNVPQSDKALGVWLTNQKMYYKNNTLTLDRVEKLKSLGVIFSSKSEWFWRQKYDSLTRFKEQYGHCNVTISYPDYQDLYDWLSSQRTRYLKGTLKEEYIVALTELGLIWDTKKFSWDSQYAQLIEFQKETGHTNVPKKHQLGQWVSDQRKNYKQGKLSVDRLSKLNDIGFLWNPLEWYWNEKYTLLKNFYKKNGHSRVPFETQYKPLYDWIILQRELYKNKKLSEDRMLKLNHLNFIWDSLSDTWNERYQELVIFKQEKGHFKVPAITVLGRWVRIQNGNYKKGKLSDDRMARLSEIGFFDKS